jgi:2-C-methyl-D-erythritol 4-phosphate cytidylyltransferase
MMNRDFSVSAVIVAAGRGTRAGLKMNKVYAGLKGQPVLVHSILPFLQLPQTKQVIVSISQDDLFYFNRLVLENEKIKKYNDKITFAYGGATRQESVYNGLLKTDPETTLVAVHDGARPLVRIADIYKVFDKALSVGSACLGVKVKDTVKRTDQNGFITETLNREELIAMQTPQVFRREIILDSYEQAFAKNLQGSDDATLAEMAGYKVAVVLGSHDNIKITTPEEIDLERAERDRKEAEATIMEETEEVKIHSLKVLLRRSLVRIEVSLHLEEEEKEKNGFK